MNDDSAGHAPPAYAGGSQDPEVEPPASGEICEIAAGVFARVPTPLPVGEWPGVRIAPNGALSPSLWKDREAPAFELKFQLFLEQARAIAAWAAHYLQLDPHADPARDNTYHVHGLYFDTPALDVYQRSPGYKKRKYRLRRYGDNAAIFLEQKRKSEGKVAKRRVQVAETELEQLRQLPLDTEWLGHWFHRRIAKRALQPSCLISYERQAYFGHNAEGPLRLTLDHNVRSKPADGWTVAPVLDGPVMLPDQVLLELKYRRQMPSLFRALMQDFGLNPGPLSKYRLAIQASGRAPINGAEVT